MLAVMFTLNWRFTLVALAVTPLLARLRRSGCASVVKQATRDVRRRQSEIVSIVQEGLGAIRVVKAFAQGAFERQRLGREEPRERRGGALRAARAVAARPGGDGAGRDRHGRVLWFGARLVLDGRDDRRRAGRLHDLSRQAVPADPGSRAREHEHRAGRGRPGARAGRCSTPTSGCRARRTPRALDTVEGRVEFRDVTFGYDPAVRC